MCGSVWLSKKSCDVYMMVQMAVLLGCLSLAWSLETQRFTISCNFLCYCVSLSMRYASNMACNWSTLINRIPVNRAPMSLKQKKRVMEMMRRPHMLAT